MYLDEINFSRWHCHCDSNPSNYLPFSFSVGYQDRLVLPITSAERAASQAGDGRTGHGHLHCSTYYNTRLKTLRAFCPLAPRPRRSQEKRPRQTAGQTFTDLHYRFWLTSLVQDSIRSPKLSPVFLTPFSTITEIASRLVRRILILASAGANGSGRWV